MRSLEGVETTLRYSRLCLVEAGRLVHVIPDMHLIVCPDVVERISSTSLWYLGIKGLNVVSSIRVEKVQPCGNLRPAFALKVL